MNTKKKKAEPKPANRKLKLPPGTVLLARPDDPTKDFHCVRCGHEWAARKDDGLPERCPHCSSPYWNKARTLARRAGVRCQCRYCKHTWIADKPGQFPVNCPHCRRYDWNDDPALPSAKPPTKK